MTHMKHTLTSYIAGAAIIACLNNAFSAPVTEPFSYQSTLNSDASGPLDLTAELNYDDAQSSAPIAVVMHGYSGSTGKTAEVRTSAQRLRDYGFFAISVAMRGRDGSDGVRDSGGIEIYDIYDAVEAIKAAYPALVNPAIVYITGYSGGGGNTMSALTKFPDYFNAGAAFFGMSDYGYDLTDGWYFDGAGSRTSQLDIDIGNPTPVAMTNVTDRYHARASNLASVNNPYTEIHIFVNDNETICPPVNSLTFLSNAVSQQSFAGEFTNISVHIGNSSLYQDFDGDTINDSNELQYWPHGSLTTDQQYAAEHWFMDRLLAGELPQPVLNTTDSLFVAGFVRTDRFACFVGDGQEGAIQLDYDLTSSNLTFQTTVLSLNTQLTSRLVINTDGFVGRKLEVLLNGISQETFAGGGEWTADSLAHEDTLELKDIGPAVIWWTDVNFDSIVQTSATANATLNGATGDVWVYYGTNNVGPQHEGWAYTNFAGSSVATGLVTSTLIDLLAGQTYACVFYATNTAQAAEAWSTVETFTTEAAPPPPSLPEEPLRIDFNDNDNGPRAIQDGYTEITGSGGTVASGYAVGDALTIELTSGLDDRDRGALTGGPGVAQSDLLRDFIFRNTGTGLGITLTTLEAGEYNFTGFFHDNSVQQGEGTLGVDTGDGQGELLKVPGFTYSTGTAPSTIGTASLSFVADGSSPVTIYLRDTAGTQPYCINGFILTKASSTGTLVAYYDFEDDLVDSSGNNNHGTAGGDGMSFLTSTPTALLNSTECADFDGNGYVSLPYLGLYSSLAATNGLTISLWIKSATSSATSWFLGEGYTDDDLPGYLFGHAVNYARPTALIRTLGGSSPLNKKTATAALYDGSWHHWVWTDKNGTANMYIDGVPVAADSGTWSYTHSSIPFDTTTIGAWIRDAAETRTYPLVGQIDDVSIWNTVLSTNDISQLYTGTSPKDLNSLGGMSNIVFSTVQPYAGQMAVYRAGFIPAVAESTDITFDLSAFGTGIASGMNLSAVSTSVTDYTFSGFSFNPTTLTVDNDAKTVTFAGGVTTADIMHTIEAVPGTTGWRIKNPSNPKAEFVNIRTSSNEGEVDVAVVATLPDSELVAYYTFENNFKDATTNLLHGTSNGGVTFTSDTPLKVAASEKACEFNGSNYVTLPYIGLYNELAAPGAGGLSVSLWIKGESTPASSWFISEGYTVSSSPAYTFGHVLNSVRPRVYIRTNSGSGLLDKETDSNATASALFDGEWHHWLWTDNNGTAQVYIDGISVPSSAANGEWNYTRGTLTLNTTTIGALVRTSSDNKYPFVGRIDEVSIWRTTLRNEDIQALAAGVTPESIIDRFDHKLQGTVIVVY